MKEISELIEADPTLGEQISVFKNDISENQKLDKNFEKVKMRLNKYLSQAGIASRRKSDELIKMATTTVNGKICFDPAYDVKSNDIIYYENKKVSLNKRKLF